MRESYIYQTIHTLAHQPLHVAQHCRILERAFMDVYFRPLILDEKSISDDIRSLLRERQLTTEVSIFVELRIDLDGCRELVVSEISIYEGYSVRSIAPAAECVTFESPFGIYPTSTRRELLKFANDIATNFGGDVAVECDRSGRVISILGGAIFGVVGRKLISADTVVNVERGLIIEAAERLELEVIEQQFTKRELALFDELFVCNHYGVTSISRCGERLYVPALVERLIEELTQPWI